MPMITGNAQLGAKDPNAHFAAEVLVAEILDVHPQYVNAVYQLPEEGSTSADLVTQAIAFRRTVQQSRQEAQRMEALLAAITVGELTRRLRAGEGMRQYVFSFTVPWLWFLWLIPAVAASVHWHHQHDRAAGAETGFR
eukprot:g31164.t1